MSYLKEAWAHTAESIIKNMRPRGIEGHYCETREEAVALVMNMMPQGSVIGWGGSMTLQESGLMEALESSDYTLLDRMTAKTDQEKRQMHAKMVMTDYYLMSANAITLDGQMMNIDGNGNRVACLIHGPEHVIVLAGMNKVVPNEQAAYDRIRNMASPANAVRLGLNTPCAKLGVCKDCQQTDCMCSVFVTTRRCKPAGRIQVVLIGEALGY